jgi:hypothetical protein
MEYMNNTIETYNINLTLSGEQVGHLLTALFYGGKACADPAVDMGTVTAESLDALFTAVCKEMVKDQEF